LKKIPLLVSLLLLFGNSFAQLTSSGSPDNVFVFSLGAATPFMNNIAFNAWAKTNYNKNVAINNQVNYDSNLAFVFKKWDLDIHIDGNSTLGVISLDFGRRLTPQHSIISSFLNFEIGEFSLSYNDIVPVGYTLTADQQGKKLDLQYVQTFIGLSSKNYLNMLHFRTGKRGGVSINSGFFGRVGYMPQRTYWQYGYSTSSVDLTSPTFKQTYFHGVNIPGIPKLNDVFADVGLFIGIGN